MTNFRDMFTAGNDGTVVRHTLEHHAQMNPHHSPESPRLMFWKAANELRKREGKPELVYSQICDLLHQVLK